MAAQIVQDRQPWSIIRGQVTPRAHLKGYVLAGVPIVFYVCGQPALSGVLSPVGRLHVALPLKADCQLIQIHRLWWGGTVYNYQIWSRPCHHDMDWDGGTISFEVWEIWIYLDIFWLILVKCSCNIVQDRIVSPGHSFLFPLESITIVQYMEKCCFVWESAQWYAHLAIVTPGFPPPSQVNRCS